MGVRVQKFIARKQQKETHYPNNGFKQMD